MKPYIAEFILDGDLRLPDDVESIKWVEGVNSLEIWNVSKTSHRVEKSLKAHLIIQSESLVQAKEDCQDILARMLNALCVVTMCSLSQSELRRVVDWSKGLSMREALYFSRTPRIAMAEPAFTQEIMDSARAFSPAFKSSRAQTALRWFRLGLSLGSPEEQFVHFWFALENAAEALKGEEHTAHKCPDCESDLTCRSCGSTPIHRKFAAEAIRDLIYRAIPDEADQRRAFKTLVSVRHALMHGRRMESALKKTEFNEGDVTNLLADITRISLFRLVDPETAPKGQHQILQSADVVRSDLVLSGQIESVFGAPDKPDLTANEGIHFSITYPGEPDEAAK